MIELRETEIDALIRMGLLQPEMRNNPIAVCEALYAHLDTTFIYAQANIETKRRALEQADGATRESRPPRWKREPALLAWLDSL